MKNDGRPRILVVDDEPLILEILLAALQNQKYYLEGCNSGEEALQKFKQQPFDVVVTDISMENLSGIDLLFAVKQIYQDVEVIIITGYASLETAQEAVAGGAYRYLRKPFNDIQDIVNIVEEALTVQHKKRQQEEKLQQAVYQRDRLQKRLGQLETMYLISHALGFAESPLAMVKDVARLLNKVMPIDWMGCLIREQRTAVIYMVLLAPLIPAQIAEFVSELKRDLPQAMPLKQVVESWAMPDKTAEANSKLIEITFPEQSILNGSVWIALPKDRNLGSDEEQLLEVTTAQMAGVIRKLQEFHRRERERIRTFAEGMVDSVILIREEGEVLLANQAAINFFQMDDLQALAQKLNQLGLMQHIEHYRETGWAIAKEIRLPDNRIVSLSVLPFSHPLEPAYTVIIRDLTQRYMIQKELERSQRLSSIGEMVSGVVHELNTPLTVILGYAQLLSGQKLPPALMHDLDTICHEAQRCQKIIQNLLGLARSRTPEKIPVEVSELVEKVLELKQYALRKRGIHIERGYNEQSIVIEAEPGQIQQVLLNLLNNAQDALQDQQQQKKISIGIARTNDNAMITIADNGPGIPADNQDRIFDPFYTTKQPGKGSGLGLSICYKILQEHNGDIRCGNGPECGAMFTITIPLAANHQSAKTTWGLVFALKQEMVQMLTHFLKKHHVRVQAEITEGQALQRLKQQEYDIILLDLPADFQMIDNFLAAAMRNHVNKIIVLGDKFAESKIEHLGIAHLHKPFSLAELEDMLRNILPENKQGV